MLKKEIHLSNYDLIVLHYHSYYIHLFLVSYSLAYAKHIQASQRLMKPIVIIFFNKCLSQLNLYLQVQSLLLKLSNQHLIHIELYSHQDYKQASILHLHFQGYLTKDSRTFCFCCGHLLLERWSLFWQESCCEFVVDFSNQYHSS